MKEVVIVGYGGHGFVAVDILLESGNSIMGYCDSAEKQQNPYDLPYLGTEQFYFSSGVNSDKAAFVAIGNSTLREKVFSFLSTTEVEVINAIHPKSVVSKKTCLGKGAFIAAGAII